MLLTNAEAFIKCLLQFEFSLQRNQILPLLAFRWQFICPYLSIAWFFHFEHLNYLHVSQDFLHLQLREFGKCQKDAKLFSSQLAMAKKCLCESTLVCWKFAHQLISKASTWKLLKEWIIWVNFEHQFTSQLNWKL